MLCPKDKHQLEINHRQGIEIDYCPQCMGVWLDKDELDKIIELSHTDTSNTHKRTERDKENNWMDTLFDFIGSN